MIDRFLRLFFLCGVAALSACASSAESDRLNQGWRPVRTGVVHASGPVASVKADAPSAAVAESAAAVAPSVGVTPVAVPPAAALPLPDGKALSGAVVPAADSSEAVHRAAAVALPVKNDGAVAPESVRGATVDAGLKSGAADAKTPNLSDKEKLLSSVVAPGAVAVRVADPLPPPSSPPVPAPTAGDAHGYVLGIGDEVKVTIYGEEDLSGAYLVGSTGQVALPLVGSVAAAGHTISQFEAAVREKLSAGYLKDPRVSAQVNNYRPFFILGEVAKPGSYPYVNGMTALNAVALAGGYTYRADKNDIRVVHANDPEKNEQDLDEDASVLPGDIIRVPERFF